VVVIHDRVIHEVLKVIAIPARDRTEIVAMIDLVLYLLLLAGGVGAALLIVVEVWAVADGMATEDLRCLYLLEMDLIVLVVDLLRPLVVEDGMLHHPIVHTKV